MDKWKISKLYFEIDTEPYALERDSKIKELALKKKVVVEADWGHTLFNLDSFFEKSKVVPSTYNTFLKAVEKMGKPNKPLSEQSYLFPKEKLQFDFNLPEEISFNALYTLPKLEELGFERTIELEDHPLKGGENHAKIVLENYLKQKTRVIKFSKPKSNPAHFWKIAPKTEKKTENNQDFSDNFSTTLLSPYLKFGCLSIKEFYHKIQEIIEGKKSTTPPESLLGQILFREYFYLNSYKTPNFHQIENNKLCRQIKWEDNEKYLTAFKEAKTGFPLIDAIILQLKQFGWMHHLFRHSVACFLTRGNLWQRLFYYHKI